MPGVNSVSGVVAAPCSWLCSLGGFMGVKQSIDCESFPRQRSWLGKRTVVCFKYDTSHQMGGVFVRCDEEEPGVCIIRLDDGRHVLTTECMHKGPID